LSIPFGTILIKVVGIDFIVSKMTGKKGRSGSKPKEITRIKDYLTQHPDNVIEVLDALRNKALITIPITCPECEHKHSIKSVGDTQAAIYYCDRILGKPKVSITEEIKHFIPSQEDYANYVRILTVDPIEDIKLLTGDNGDD